jgi:hypothetical protein
MATIQSISNPSGTFRDLVSKILHSVLDTRDCDQLFRVDLIGRYPSLSVKDAEQSKRASTGFIVSRIIDMSQHCPKPWKKLIPISSGENNSVLLDFPANEWTSSCYIIV